MGHRAHAAQAPGKLLQQAAGRLCLLAIHHTDCCIFRLPSRPHAQWYCNVLLYYCWFAPISILLNAQHLNVGVPAARARRGATRNTAPRQWKPSCVGQACLTSHNKGMPSAPGSSLRAVPCMHPACVLGRCTARTARQVEVCLSCHEVWGVGWQAHVWPGQVRRRPGHSQRAGEVKGLVVVVDDAELRL